MNDGIGKVDVVVSVLKPSAGRIVRYMLSEEDAAAITRRRSDAINFGAKDNHTGYLVHAGNPVTAGDQFPLLITGVWEDGSINGQVFLDGTDTLWVTSRHEGERGGEWRWPERI